MREIARSEARLIVATEVPPVDWETFRTTYPMGSIALDGYVIGAPRFDPKGPYYNANHHEDVDRLATLSTAQQIAMSLRMGLEEAFRNEDGVFAPEVYVNDCDQDVCLAWYLLAHPEAVNLDRDDVWRANRLLSVGGVLDTTAGSYPFPRDMRYLDQANWIFEPYTAFRASGEMSNKDDTQYEAVIYEVGERIAAHLGGAEHSTPLELDYGVMHVGNGWKMIEALGRDGRTGALLDGLQAYVLTQQISDDRWRYSIGRISEFIPFPVGLILDRLNLVEGCTDDRWGGASIIGGSPRVGGSSLSPDAVIRVIEEIMHSKN